MYKVSCITVTRNRVDHLKKCILYFKNQTHEYKELIIVYYNNDESTKKFLKENQEDLNSNSIYFHMFIDDDGLYLGSVRNYAVSKATGEWLCIWDDDDWFSPNRIESQLSFCIENDLEASDLRCILIYSNKHQLLKLSFERVEGWEGSLFVKKSIMPKYKNIKTGEDTPVVMSLLFNNKFRTQFNPELYIYIFHDANISSSRHKQEIFDCSYELDSKKQRYFKEQIDWL